MLRLCLACAFAVSLVAPTYSQSDPIQSRRDDMRAVASATRDGAGMADGRTPFDAAEAKRVFETYSRSARHMAGLYPPDSRSGGGTRAAARIWEDKAGFEAALAKFDREAMQAAAASTDLASFRQAFESVSRNCTNCHQNYRAAR